MLKYSILLLFIMMLSHKSIGQSRDEIDKLLLSICNIKDSKNISNTEQAKKIVKYGVKNLPILATFFTDTTQTKVKSDCQDFYLRKGEIAIILADQIERMPYSHLTGIQNCLLEFCENNPNFIEYYLYAIRRGGVSIFKDKYLKWLREDK